MTRKHSSFCLRSRVVTGGPRARGAHTAEATTRAPPQPRIRGGAGRGVLTHHRGRLSAVTLVCYQSSSGAWTSLPPLSE